MLLASGVSLLAVVMSVSRVFSRPMLGCDNEGTKEGVTAPGASEEFSTVFILISLV